VRGDHALLGAPTAAGKTEAAILPLLSRMATERWSGVSVVYLCPLRALLNNLGPRIAAYGELIGRRAALWHGDVGDAQRRAILRDPPEVLLTTPESLEAMALSRRVDDGPLLGAVRAVVVDEIHAFAADDRGWHLLALLNRLDAHLKAPAQRVGLTATSPSVAARSSATARLRRLATTGAASATESSISRRRSRSSGPRCSTSTAPTTSPPRPTARPSSARRCVRTRRR
jgi:Lhr-like helicase